MQSHCKIWAWVLSGWLMAAAGCPAGEQTPWRKVDEGLFVAMFDAPVKSKAGDSKITILKIDPKQYAFKLLCASEHDNRKWTAREWCEKFGLVAAINAGMYQADGLTHVAYMQNGGQPSNSRRTKDKCFIAFGRVDSTVPEFQILDTQYQDLGKVGPRYSTLIQNVRAVSLRGENVWAQQPREWSMALMATDQDGNVLWIFTRSPYSVHDFVGILLALPLSLRNAAYLDGGPPASLYMSNRRMTRDLFGSYETGVNETDNNTTAWRIPNVIGIVKKRQ